MIWKREKTGGLFADGKSRRRNVTLSFVGVFRRSLILYRCHREKHAYSWDTPRLINVGLLVIRLKCAFLGRCFKHNPRPVTPPGRPRRWYIRAAPISRTRYFISLLHAAAAVRFYLPEEIIMQPHRLAAVCAAPRHASPINFRSLRFARLSRDEATHATSIRRIRISLHDRKVNCAAWNNDILNHIKLLQQTNYNCI